MAKYPTSRDDVIDSRDVIAAIEELRPEREALVEALEEADNAVDNYDPDEDEGAAEAEITQAACDARSDLETWDVCDEGVTLKALEALAAEASGAADWEYGATLIRGSYFTEYAEQLADDIGAVNSEARWPNTYIDWEAAAEELKQDYFSVEFHGVTYWLQG